MKISLICMLLLTLSLVPAGFCTTSSNVHDHARQVTPKVQHGVASWYGDKEQGRVMACGQPFDKHALIAATHTNLPLGTKVRVTNLRNGRSTTVQVKDRLPASSTRLIDLSRAAAALLGYVRRGLAPVRVEVVSLP